MVHKLLQRKINRDQESQTTAAKSKHTKHVQRPGGITDQKLNGQKIEDHPQGSRNPILRVSSEPRAMIHFELGDLGAALVSDGRNETMHFTVELQIFSDFAPHRLQCTAVIVQFDLG